MPAILQRRNGPDYSSREMSAKGCATLARRASEGKSLRLPRLRVGLVTGAESSAISATSLTRPDASAILNAKERGPEPLVYRRARGGCTPPSRKGGTASPRLAVFLKYRHKDVDIDNPGSVTITDRLNPLNTYTYAVAPNSWTNRKQGESKLKIKEMGSRYLFICLYIWLEKYFSGGDFRKSPDE